MTDSLRAILVYACKDVCPLVLSEDEVKTYPYAVYDMTTAPLQDKDSIYAFVGDTRVRVVSNDKSEADTKAAALQTAILALRNETIFTKLVDVNKECVEGIWTIEMNYILKQYADWSEPVEQTTNTE